MNNLPAKALLIVDNGTSHKIDRQDDNFRLIFLPPNATALIQPLDQNVLRSTKIRYRNKLLSHIISSSLDIANALKTIDLALVFQFVSDAWNSLPPELVSVAWKPLLSPDEILATNVETLGNAINSNSDKEMSLETLGNTIDY